MPTPRSRLLRLLERSAGRPFYPAVIAAVAAADYVVPGSPSNVVLVASVLPRPERWRTLGVAFAVGCAAGALLLATLLGYAGEPAVAWVRGGEAGPLWDRVEGYVDAWGLFALAALAITPLPTRIAVAVLALAGTAPPLLAGVVLAGRLVSYPAVAWLAARAPGTLARLRPFAWLAPTGTAPTGRG